MPPARALLVASDLPVDDLDHEAITLFGAFDGATLVGVIGLQSCGPARLLRSLAVAPERQGHGIARALCDRVFELASSRDLWLLTTTARDYFARLGFEPVDRGHVPEEIRTTTQFSSLCPASAHVMRRR